MACSESVYCNVLSDYSIYSIYIHLQDHARRWTWVSHVDNGNMIALWTLTTCCMIAVFTAMCSGGSQTLGIFPAARMTSSPCLSGTTISSATRCGWTPNEVNGLARQWPRGPISSTGACSSQDTGIQLCGRFSQRHISHLLCHDNSTAGGPYALSIAGDDVQTNPNEL